MVLLTDEEILDAYATEESIEFLSGSRGIAKAQLKKVLDEAKVEDMSWKFRQALKEACE